MKVCKLLKNIYKKKINQFKTIHEITRNWKAKPAIHVMLTVTNSDEKARAEWFMASNPKPDFSEENRKGKKKKKKQHN